MLLAVCALLSYGALGKFGEHSMQEASFVLSVCILHLAHSLHPAVCINFYPCCAVCILILPSVCILHLAHVQSTSSPLQFAFYPCCAVCILHLAHSLHPAVCSLPLLCSLHFTLSLHFTPVNCCSLHFTSGPQSTSCGLHFIPTYIHT